MLSLLSYRAIDRAGLLCIFDRLTRGRGQKSLGVGWADGPRKLHMKTKRMALRLCEHLASSRDGRQYLGHRGRAMPEFLDLLFYIIVAVVAVVLGGCAVASAIRAWRDWSDNRRIRKHLGK
jgi:hypothetical protein